MSKKAKIFITGIATIAVGTSVYVYVANKPSEFELAARDLAAAKIAARTAGLSLTWDEYHKLHNTPTGRDLAPVIRKWREPFAGASEIESLSPAMLEARLATIWKSHRKDIDIVASFSTYESYTIESTAKHSVPINIAEDMADIHVFAFLATSIRAAEQFGRKDEVLRLLECGFKIIELQLQEPSFIVLMRTEIGRSYLIEAITLSINKHKDDLAFLEKTLEIVRAHSPKLSLEDVVEAEFVESIAYYDWISKQNFEVRLAFFDERVDVIPKTPWSNPTGHLRDMQYDAHIKRIASDKFAVNGFTTMYMDSVADLFIRLETGPFSNVDWMVARDWYDMLWNESNDVSMALNRSFSIFTLISDRLRSIHANHSLLQGRLETMIKK